MGIVEASLGQDHPEMGAALINLGFAAQDLGDFETADASYQRAERIVTDHFDRSHPLTASVFLHRGRLFAARGRLDEAVELLEQARQILVEIGQPQPESGEASVELTAVLTRLGRLDEAGAALQSGLGELERSLPVGHPLLARAQVAQSILERARADRDE
jgi:tetratricopeptide (TPR) repeat protein